MKKDENERTEVAAAVTEKAKEAKKPEKAKGKATPKAEKADTPMVYCGPSIRGVARQYTVFNGDMPEMLKQFIEEHPIARMLIVPTAEFAEMRRKLETKGSSESVIFKEVKSEL